MSQPTPSSWLQTTAKVTSCKYEFARMNTLTLGVATDTNKFLIGFTYRAHGEDFTGQFSSSIAVPQGETFSLSYNPIDPQQNSKSDSLPSTRTALFAVGIAGSILLSLLYLGVMRGCN